MQTTWQLDDKSSQMQVTQLKLLYCSALAVYGKGTVSQLAQGHLPGSALVQSRTSNLTINSQTNYCYITRSHYDTNIPHNARQNTITMKNYRTCLKLRDESFWVSELVLSWLVFSVELCQLLLQSVNVGLLLGVQLRQPRLFTGRTVQLMLQFTHLTRTCCHARLHTGILTRSLYNKSNVIISSTTIQTLISVKLAVLSVAHLHPQQRQSSTNYYYYYQSKNAMVYFQY